MKQDGARVVIFGVGGLARELWGWIKNGTNVAFRERVAGFVVDDAAPAGTYDSLPVLSREEASKWGYLEYVVAVADPRTRYRVARELNNMGWGATKYVHESALLGVNLSIGEGTIVFPRCSLSSDARIGDHVLVNGGTAVGHDCIIGSFSSLLGGISVNGNVTVGERVLIGAGAIIHPGKRIGDEAVIGMGSVVFRDVKEGETVYGNPAKRLSDGPL